MNNLSSSAATLARVNERRREWIDLRQRLVNIDIGPGESTGSTRPSIWWRRIDGEKTCEYFDLLTERCLLSLVMATSRMAVAGAAAC